MPRVNELLEKIGRAQFITTLNLCKVYWQVPLDPASRPYTAFKASPWIIPFHCLTLWVAWSACNVPEYDGPSLARWGGMFSCILGWCCHLQQHLDRAHPTPQANSGKDTESRFDSERGKMQMDTMRSLLFKIPARQWTIKTISQQGGGNSPQPTTKNKERSKVLLESGGMVQAVYPRICLHCYPVDQFVG